MYKKIFVLIVFINFYSCAMQQPKLPLRLSLENRVRNRVNAFNEWKKDPEITARLNTDEPGTVSAYIHLTMFMRAPEEDAKSPEKIAEATQFAKQACPSYQFWPEYYEVYSRTKRGKCYSDEEQMELVLGPTMTKITRLKMTLALLKGQEIASLQLVPNWKKEIETMGVLRKDLSLIPLIPVVIPPKKQELRNLKQEFEQCFLSDYMRATINRDQESRQRLVQQEQVQANLQRQMQALYEALRAKDQEMDIARQLGAASLREKLAALGAKETKESEIAQLKERQSRIASSLALFEASKTTGWEVALVETLKSELGK